MDNIKDKKKKGFNEWEWFKAKFGKWAYLLFPLFHLIGLGIIAGIVFLVIKLIFR